MNLKKKLSRAIRRSEKAYSLYHGNKFYFQALRIYKANLIVYALLEEYLFDCEEKDLDQVFNYIYHLEDWFENFHAAQVIGPALEDKFAFESLPDSPGFPSDFVKNVIKNN